MCSRASASSIDEVELDAAWAHVRTVAERSGSSFLAGIRILPRSRREAMYAIYAYCREIDDIADSTKISTAYLNAIEQEDFLSTPAPVYLRGFIKTVARELKLDMNLVAASYMARYEAATES